jgi:tryptophan-rich sensory protein
MNSYTSYAELIKPDWAPPAFLFGPVWSVLYLIIAISFTFIFYKTYKGALPRMVALPFLLNLIFNLAFTPIQFGLKNNLLALIDIALVLVTLIWALCVIYKKFRIVALANIPYLLWVSFATALQATITFLNW